MGWPIALYVAGQMLKYQGDMKAAAESRRRSMAKKLAIKRNLEQGTYAQGRQGFANTNIQRRGLLDARSEAGVEARLNEMRVASSLKASGVPQGQSTRALSRNLEGDALRKESAMLAQLDQKKAELFMRDQNLQQQMDMAWLDAQAQIAGIYGKSGPSFGAAAIGVGSAYYQGQVAEKQMESP